MLISNKIHYFRNFWSQIYDIPKEYAIFVFHISKR